jgi:hypothetical protein
MDGLPAPSRSALPLRGEPWLCAALSASESSDQLPSDSVLNLFSAMQLVDVHSADWWLLHDRLRDQLVPRPLPENPCISKPADMTHPISEPERRYVELSRALARRR